MSMPSGGTRAAFVRLNGRRRAARRAGNRACSRRRNSTPARRSRSGWRVHAARPRRAARTARPARSCASENRTACCPVAFRRRRRAHRVRAQPANRCGVGLARERQAPGGLPSASVRCSAKVADSSAAENGRVRGETGGESTARRAGRPCRASSRVCADVGDELQRVMELHARSASGPGAMSAAHSQPARFCLGLPSNPCPLLRRGQSSPGEKANEQRIHSRSGRAWTSSRAGRRQRALDQPLLRAHAVHRRRLVIAASASSWRA